MNDSIIEQISKIDELTFPTNVWGIESYRSSAVNDYDYLIAAVRNEQEAQTAFTVTELGDADETCIAEMRGNSESACKEETNVQADAESNVSEADCEADAMSCGDEASQEESDCSDESDAVVTGYALLRCFDDAEIIRIATDSRCRRQGIGSMLLEALLAEVHKRDIHSIFLEVRSSNMPAIKLYEHAGFERAGVRRDYYSAPTEDAIIMRYTW